jgi:hypothetical protein
MTIHCNLPGSKGWVNTSQISRGAFLRGSLLTALSATRTFAFIDAATGSIFYQAQAPSTRWSDAARNQLKDMQEKAYAQLGKRLGMSDDPLTVYKSISQGRIPAERISWKRFEEEFGAKWGKTEGWEKQKQVFEEYFKRYYDNAELPTPYEDPNLYLILQPLVDAVEEAVKSVDLPIPRHLLFGTLPTGALDAQSIPVPRTKDYIVVFQYGIFNFLFEMSKLAARVLPPLVPDKAKQKFQAAPDPASVLKNHPEIKEQFNKILYSFVADDPRLAPVNLPLDSSYMPTAGRLLNCIELFILGHEYTHIIYHHLEDNARFQGSHKEQVQRARQTEYDADILGHGLMYGAMGSTDPELTLWAPDYYFSCMDALQYCLTILKGAIVGFDEDSVHPPFVQRREELRRDLRRFPPEVTDSSIKLGKQLETFLGDLSMESLPVWMMWNKKGVKPSPIWQ